MTDSYDQYAEQLLNKVFQNVKQTASPPAVSHEDQLLNQILLNTPRFANGLPSTPVYGNSNELFLLQQLNQQQMLLERQQQLLSPSLSFPQIPTQHTAIEPPPAVIEEPPVKKIARVPVSAVIPDPVVEEKPIIQQSVQPSPLKNQSSPPSQLKKKKSFIGLLAERTNKNKEFAAAAALATATMKEKSIQQQFKNRRQEQAYVRLQAQEQAQIEAEAQAEAQAELQSQQTREQIKYIPQKSKKKVIAAKSYETPRPVIEKRPSFWKPREERPKGWWKGQKGHTNKHQEDEYEEIEVEDEEEEEEVIIVPPKKTKTVVVKRVVVPKKVPSIKGTKPKRPMAFKPPPSRKNKVSEKKTTHSETCTHATSATSAMQPMFVMPQQQMYQQQMYQQPYYPQPMMMPQQNGYYGMPNMMGGGMFQGPQVSHVKEEKEAAAPARRNTTVYNPRESTNDKCSIM